MEKRRKEAKVKRSVSTTSACKVPPTIKKGGVINSRLTRFLAQLVKESLARIRVIAASQLQEGAGLFPLLHKPEACGDKHVLTEVLKTFKCIIGFSRVPVLTRAELLYRVPR